MPCKFWRAFLFGQQQDRRYKKELYGRKFNNLAEKFCSYPDLHYLCTILNTQGYSGYSRHTIKNN